MNSLESPDNFDANDFIYAQYLLIHKSKKAPPVKLDYRSYIKPILNIHNKYSGSVAAACIKDWIELANIDLNQRISHESIYQNVNTFDRICCRNILKTLKNTGCVVAGLQNEQDNKIDSYWRINTIDELKFALFDNGPCLISFPHYNDSSEFWCPNLTNEIIKGTHIVCIVGYNKHGFIIQNCWGDNWSENGYGIYPYSAFGMHWDIWVIIDKHAIRHI